jgi:hypothetical protein
MKAQDGGFLLAGFYCIAFLALLLTGPGRFSISGSRLGVAVSDVAGEAIFLSGTRIENNEEKHNVVRGDPDVSCDIS